MITVICKTCGKAFQAFPSAKRKFCSQRCHAIFRRGKKRPDHSEYMKKNSPSKRPDVSQKISKALKGRRKSKEHIAKILASRRSYAGKSNPFYGKHHNQETKKLISRKIKKRFQEDPDYRRRISESRKGKLMPREIRKRISTKLKGRTFSEETRKKLSEASKRLWANPNYKRRMIRMMKEEGWVNNITDNLEIRPTKPELKLISLINKYNLPFRYVGDGAFWITVNYDGDIFRLNPDFLCTMKEKSVIEVFGEYWHSPHNPKIPKSSLCEIRKAIFEDAGWECLVLWANELSDEKAVLSKIEKVI